MKILVLDIETKPILAHVWGLWDNNVALNQIVEDPGILSWSAKWYENESGQLFGPHNKVMYMDQSSSKDINDEKKILEGMWKLLDECDAVVGQNIKKFDIKKLNGKFLLYKMKPPSPYIQYDTLTISKKYFDFPSFKLEYLSDKLCKKYKKLKHKRFPGHTLWVECLKGNRKAWAEMKRYNIHDVLSTEELFNILKAWDTSINFSIYSDLKEIVCNCGSAQFQSRGQSRNKLGIYRRFQCKKCGHWTKGKLQPFTKEQKANIRGKA